MKFFHTSVLLAFALLLFACSKAPVIETGENAQILEGSNLHKVDNTNLAGVFVDPDVNFSKYTKILIVPLSMEETKIIQPTSSRGSRPWVLEERDKQLIDSSYQKMMAKYLVDEGGYELVTEAGAGVVVIQGAIIALAPSAPKDDGRSRASNSVRSRTFTDSAGRITMAMVLVDGETGQPLVKWVDARSGWGTMRSNNSVSNLSDVNLIFSSWASQLRRGLHRLSDEAK